MDAVVQVVAVGVGASVGRENAPRQASASLAEWLSTRLALPLDWQRLIIAGAAGAGLAAVYNVPAAGVVFACGLLLRSWGWRPVVVAAPMSAIATVVARPVVGDRPVYEIDVAGPTWATVLLCVLSAVAGVPIGMAFRWLADRARVSAQTTGWATVLGLAAVGLALGGLSLWLPALPGNGKALVETALAEPTSVGVLIALVVAKPLITAAYLRAGAVGGLLTPALGSGAAAGAAIAVVARSQGLAVDAPVVVLVGAAVVLAISQRSALFAGLLTWELAWSPWWVLGMLLVLAAAARELERVGIVTGRRLARRRS